MSELKYCQGTSCHEYKTKDRIKGTKGSKSYQTRRRSSFYYGHNNFCSLNCQNDWFRTFGDRAITHLIYCSFFHGFSIVLEFWTIINHIQ